MPAKDANISKLYRAAQEEAVKLTEQMARKILREHPNLDEFIMAMGGWSFTIKGSPEHISEGDRAYLEPIYKLFCDWNEELHIGGHPMRFTADGEIRTDW